MIVTAPGEEGQVDYGDGPMVRHPETGKYRRTRLVVFTLGYNRKSVRLLTFQSNAPVILSGAWSVRRQPPPAPGGRALT